MSAGQTDSENSLARARVRRTCRSVTERSSSNAGSQTRSSSSSISALGCGASSSQRRTWNRRPPWATSPTKPSCVPRWVISASVPVSNRCSPPPTSCPRSISTTPKAAWSALSSSASMIRYRSSKIRSRSGMYGNSTEPSGNIGSTAIEPANHRREMPGRRYCTFPSPAAKRPIGRSRRARTEIPGGAVGAPYRSGMTAPSRYTGDVLAAGWQRAARPVSTELALERGQVLEDLTSGFCGAVLFWENGLVVLEDRKGKRRSFPLGGGLTHEGRPVIVTAPDRERAERNHDGPRRARSAGPSSRARTALASRIFVEGRHDAELVEKVWGEDLRQVGVVVEYLGGDRRPAADRVGLRTGARSPAGRARRSPGAGQQGVPDRSGGRPRRPAASSCRCSATPTSTSGRRSGRSGSVCRPGRRSLAIRT